MSQRVVLATVVAAFALLAGSAQSAPAQDKGHATLSPSQNGIYVSADLDSLARMKHRPKVGVALSGGGAKGSAHIGVLKFIDELGIPVDYVTGTSMGSIVGGLYALGYSPDEMQQIISSIDWRMYILDRIPDKLLSHQQREVRSEFVTDIPFSLNSYKDTLSILQTLPGGAVLCNNLENMLNSLCVGYQGDIDFNKLPIPYACVGTDMINSEEVVFHSGSLAKAIRSSMSIPGIFAPVRTGSKVLVDGGLKNNFPVDVCKQMGADIVIGVMVGSDTQKDTNSLHSVVEVLGGLMGVVTKGRNAENNKACDILIRPDITNFGVMSFNTESINKLVSNGYEAAEQCKDELTALKAYLSRWGEEGKTLQAPKAKYIGDTEMEVGTIRIEGFSDKEVRWLMHKSGLEKYENTTMTGQMLKDMISIMYGVGIFSKVEYVVSEDEKTHRMNIKIMPTYKQPDALNLAFHFDNYEASAIILRMALNAHRISKPHLEVKTKLGYNPYITALFSYSNIYMPKINFSATVKKSEATLCDFGKEFGSARLVKQNTRLFVSEAYSRHIGAQLGLEYEQFLQSRLFTDGFYKPMSTGTSGNPFLGLYGQFAYDNRDAMYFPTSGFRAELYANWRFVDFRRLHDFGGFEDVIFKLDPSIKITDRLTFSPQVYARILMGDGYKTGDKGYDFSYSNFMGGLPAGHFVDQQLPFVGLNKPEQMYDNLAIALGELRWNFKGKNYLSLMGSFARESYSLAHMFSKAERLPEEQIVDNDEYSAYDWWGAGIQYSRKMPLGPLRLGLSYSNLTQKLSLSFSLGYDF